MTNALYLLLYGVLVTWLAPPLLSLLTRRGTNPRLGVAAWLAAMVGVLMAWVGAVTVVTVTIVGGTPNSSVIVLCLELLGMPEREASLGRVTALGLVAVGLLVSAVVSVGVGRSVLGLRSRSEEHADAARLLGMPTDAVDVFVVTDEHRAAYCVVGRPHAIVVTTAAVQALDGPQLDAVLAHESAHIAGRHHHLMMVLRSLAKSLAHLPLFTRGASEVAALLEMCADDAAARRHGPRPLVAGMLALASPLHAPAGGLAVGATATAARAHRLLEPARWEARWCHRLAVSATIVGTLGAPLVVNALCHH